MNKAAFLDILHHVSAITDQEISELEQLALNFPYCQSAHLLLAKAAYDRGSMLSNQKLRRAAACATNRQLLKKLIYTSGSDLVLSPIAPPREDSPVETPGEVEPETFLSSTEPETLPSIDNTTEPGTKDIPDKTPEPVLEPPVYPNSEKQLEPDSESLLPAPSPVEETELNNIEAAIPEEERLPAATVHPNETPQTEPEIRPDNITQPEETTLKDEVNYSEIETIYLDEAPLDEQITLSDNIVADNQPELLVDYPDDYDSLFIVDQLNPALPLVDPVTAFITNDISSDVTEQEEDINAPEVSLPTSDFEATASETTSNIDLVIADDILSRQDPIDTDIPDENSILQKATAADLGDDSETLIRFDEYLFTPEKESEPLEKNAATQDYQEEIIYKVFDANELGYWMDSSRLGETLLLKNELATARPFYFSPELFLEYSKHHELTSYEAPPASILTRQLDIIDQFLKLNPKLKSMSNVKLRPEPQEDLSLRSTKIKKTLASENLANILVQQGKIKKAIKIYEHLILKIPEKKAYFASQIEKLQNLS